MSVDTPRYFVRAGYLAAACWVAQIFVGTLDLDDLAGTARVQAVMDEWILNVILQGLWILLAVVLVFFGAGCAAAYRATGYATAVHSGWVLAAAGLMGMAWANQSALAAAENGAQASLEPLAYLQVYGWMLLLIGLATASLAMGLGSLRGGPLRRWLAYSTLVFGCLGLLGALHIPPGGFICYLMFAPWLVCLAALMPRHSPQASVQPAQKLR